LFRPYRACSICCSLTQGGARFTALALGYYLSGFQPFQFAAHSRRLLRVEKFFHPRLHRGIHLDERRPGAFETFARKFLRRFDAEFAASPREITSVIGTGPLESLISRGKAISLVAWSSTSDVGLVAADVSRLILFPVDFKISRIEGRS
jgi:hypothetical protein